MNVPGWAHGRQKSLTPALSADRMRGLLPVALLLLLPVANAGSGDAFGQPAQPRFEAYPFMGDAAAAEPSIGIPWDTDHVFVQAYSKTFRAAFGNASSAPEWDDVTAAFLPPTNLDPLLVVDPAPGRIFAGGLLGPCSLMALSDDDGATWTPSLNMCSGARFDHQSLGVGAWAPDILPRGDAGPRATYYCAQFDRVACATGLDGGRTWLPFVEVSGDCSSFHGHIKVSEVTGQAVLPFANCGGAVGFAETLDNGLTWTSVQIPGSTLGKGIGFDPSVAFTSSGWLYYAHGNDLGVFVGLSKDGGKTWETLGATTPGVTPAPWLNLTGAYTDPTGRPLRYANFVNAVAGDDDRAAVTFLGTADDGTKPWVCTKASDGLVWHYYVAQTFDAGSTWTITRISDDPVQVGGMYDGSEGSAECRNLLDFNDATVDSRGRIHIAFGDGCVAACAEAYAKHMAGEGPKPEPSDSRSDLGVLFRQVAGRGVYAAQDEGSGFTFTASPAPTEEPEQPVPGLGVVALVAAGALAAAVARRRMA
jgi:hypothetical protein